MLAAFALSASAAQAEEGRLLRFPATNGEQVVFSYAGDLYSVPIAGGKARRLTSHVGYEIFPRYSPDGKTIAFTGQYDGNTEVYTIPAEGGEPLRLTYTATLDRDDIGDRMGPNNIVMTWTPDGSQIVYRSRKQTSGFIGRLFKVGAQGGLSEVIPLPEGGFCSYSPDGKRMAYNRVFREFRTWKYYKGGMADDVWIYDPEAGSVENITKNDAQDIVPMWIGDEIFFISDRDKIMNLFVYNTKTKQTEKVTDFKEYDIKFPSAGGGMIVFENGGYIYRFDPATRKAEKVSVEMDSENVYARSELKDVSGSIRGTSVSPGGERVAVSARGEVFNLPVAEGVTKNLTRTAGVHEREARWSPDGKSIAYLSDASGEWAVYLQPQEGGEAVKLTPDSDTYIFSIWWAPDSKTIVYTDRKNRVWAVDVESKKQRVLFEDPYSAPWSISWSPDSRWITYSRESTNGFGVIYVYNLEENKEYPVTDKWFYSAGPVFTQDGKYIVFTSARDFNPTYSHTEWNHVYNRMEGVYLALLSEDTPDPFLSKDVEVGATSTADSAAGVRIDPDGLPDRIVKLPLSAGYYGPYYGDKQGRFYYQTENQTRVYNLVDKSDKLVAVDYGWTVSADGKKVLWNRGKNYYVTDLPDGEIALGKPADLSGLQVMTDYPAEWRQIFNETWRQMRDGFYLENMHGVDWPAIKAKYEVLLPYVRHSLDLNYLIAEMISELHSGHAYITPGETPRADRIKTGLLGAEISRDPSGAFRIDRILPAPNWNRALRSPLSDPGLGVEEGDYIVAIDGVQTNTVNDLYKLLVGKVDLPVELTVSDSPQGKETRKVVIKPIADEAPLYYYDWVQENIRKVDEASNGRIGYVYIPDMGVDGLNEFARYYYPQLDKEGLIIDDRANGGGNVSPMILERLSREPYRVTMSRNSQRRSTVPDGTLVGPKVCLINKYSASDGDLFPWGFRELGLGKLIGTRTWGGIIGITSPLPLIDGTSMTIPFFTSYSMRDGQWMIENHGVDPDIVIDNDPIKEWAGEDEQLNRAIEEVMKQLPDRKPVPPIPAPRDFSK